MPDPTNIELLKEAGLLDEVNTLSQEETHALNSLTSAEVDAIISASQKLGLKKGTMDNAIKLQSY